MGAAAIHRDRCSNLTIAALVTRDRPMWTTWQSIRSDALYPALSGEWEVPVTRNAKITPVNEGVGGGVGGPPLRDHLWQGPPAAQEPSQPHCRKLHLSMAISWLSLARQYEAIERLFQGTGEVALIKGAHYLN